MSYSLIGRIACGLLPFLAEKNVNTRSQQSFLWYNVLDMDGSRSHA